jgi:hypothetical protein
MEDYSSLKAMMILWISSSKIVTREPYPTDFGLFNDAREALEEMIKSVYPTGEKPCTYRNTARRNNLKYIRNWKPDAAQ